MDDGRGVNVTLIGFGMRTYLRTFRCRPSPRLKNLHSLLGKKMTPSLLFAKEVLELQKKLLHPHTSEARQ